LTDTLHLALLGLLMGVVLGGAMVIGEGKAGHAQQTTVSSR
jgi:hypothetical protein